VNQRIGIPKNFDDVIYIASLITQRFFFFLFGSEEAVNTCENLCVTMFRFFFAFDIMTLRQGSVPKILVRPFSPDPTTLPVSDRVRSLLKGLLMVKFFGASLRPHTPHTYFMDAPQRKYNFKKLHSSNFGE